MKPIYKAAVYLSQMLTLESIKGVPFFYTAALRDKDSVLNYVKTLHRHGIIQAYRLLRSPDEDEGRWSYESEVVHLEGSVPVIRGVPACEYSTQGPTPQGPTLRGEMERFLPIIEAAENDASIWTELTKGTGIATANSYRAALQGNIDP